MFTALSTLHKDVEGSELTVAGNSRIGLLVDKHLNEAIEIVLIKKAELRSFSTFYPFSVASAFLS